MKFSDYGMWFATPMQTLDYADRWFHWYGVGTFSVRDLWCFSDFEMLGRYMHAIGTKTNQKEVRTWCKLVNNMSIKRKIIHS
jgi:hypothetical protein